MNKVLIGSQIRFIHAAGGPKYPGTTSPDLPHIFPNLRSSTDPPQILLRSSPNPLDILSRSFPDPSQILSMLTVGNLIPCYFIPRSCPDPSQIFPKSSPDLLQILSRSSPDPLQIFPTSSLDSPRGGGYPPNQYVKPPKSSSRLGESLILDIWGHFGHPFQYGLTSIS